MRKFGIIHPQFWDWARENKLEPYVVVIGAFLLSCSHGNSLGCFRCSPVYVSDDTGMDLSAVKSAYSVLIKLDFIVYCELSKMVLVKKYLKWNPVKGSKQIVGIYKVIQSINNSFSHIACLKGILCHYIPENFKIDSQQFYFLHPNTNKKISIYTEKKSVNSKNNDYGFHVSKFFNRIQSLCHDLTIICLDKKSEFIPGKWVGQQINDQKHPEAIILCLEKALRKTNEVKYWSYLNQIMKIENGNFNEQESLAFHKEIKTDNYNKAIKNLSKGILGKI